MEGSRRAAAVSRPALPPTSSATLGKWWPGLVGSVLPQRDMAETNTECGPGRPVRSQEADTAPGTQQVGPLLCGASWQLGGFLEHPGGAGLEHRQRFWGTHLVSLVPGEA